MESAPAHWQMYAVNEGSAILHRDTPGRLPDKFVVAGNSGIDTRSTVHVNLVCSAHFTLGRYFLAGHRLVHSLAALLCIRYRRALLMDQR